MAQQTDHSTATKLEDLLTHIDFRIWHLVLDPRKNILTRGGAPQLGVETRDSIRVQLEEFYRTHLDMAYARARCLAGESLAEDVIHNVFTHLFEHPEILQKVRSPKAWLYTAITNKSLDMLKKNKSQLFVPLEDKLNVADGSVASEDPLKSVLLVEKMEEVRAEGEW